LNQSSEAVARIIPGVGRRCPTRTQPQRFRRLSAARDVVLDDSEFIRRGSRSQVFGAIILLGVDAGGFRMSEIAIYVASMLHGAAVTF